MKKVLLYSLTLMLTVFAFQQAKAYDFSIGGQVTFAGIQQPVPFDSVTFQIAEMGYADGTMTDENGNYSFTVEVEEGQQYAYVVGVFDFCSGMMIEKTGFVNPGGAVEDFTVCDSLNLNDCQADFGYWNLEQNAVQFENYSFAVTPITEFAWDFGDGATSDEESPVHQYAGQGTYDVTLAIVTEGGCESEIMYPVEVTNDTIMECQAMFFYFPMGDLNIQFQDVSWPNASTWAWDFGDGATSDEQNPVHQYAEAGAYNVSLTITVEETGCESTVTMDVWVEEGSGGDCQADFGYWNMEENTVQFENYSFAITPITEFAWDFGDGNTSDEESPVHQYAEEGTYDVTLAIVTEGGCESEVTYPVDVMNDTIMECQAMFFYFPMGDLNIQFQDISWPNASTWAWDFGDGATSDEQNPVHQYAEAGIYPVTLSIYVEETACESSITMEVAVDSTTFSNCFADFWYMQTGELSISFQDYSMPFPTTWAWDFGDGATSDEQNPVHEYAEGGEYQVTLTIYVEDINCESTVTYPVWVDDQNYMECFANFFWYYDPATPMSVSFENYSYSVTPIVEYAWDFGDGTTSAEENPVHQYNDYGVYTVTLAITTESGCSSDISFDVEVFDMGMYCQALFVPEIDEENPLLVHFNDLSIGNVTGWDWDFGDGETSNEQNPDHLYTEHDVYLVTLVIQTGDTCTSAFYCEIDLVNGQVVVSPGQTTGIVDHQAETPEITLYPNPVNNVLNINTGSTSDVEVQIINLAGQVMIKTTGRTVDVSSLPKGIYFARIFASGQSVTKKFIK